MSTCLKEMNPMRKSVLLVASFTTMSLLLGGCASNLSGDSYLSLIHI